MPCDESACLDKKENTKVVFGDTTLQLDEFENMINKDQALKNKMKEIERELNEKY